MRHNFNKTDTIKPGDFTLAINRTEGFEHVSSCSYYKCTKCGERFEHRYNEMDIYEAMRDQNINMDSCEEKTYE